MKYLFFIYLTHQGLATEFICSSSSGSVSLIHWGLPVPLTTSSLIITELISDPGISN